jgi:hypothetical protein
MIRNLLILILFVALVGGYFLCCEQTPQGKNVGSGVLHYGVEAVSTLDANGIVTLDGTKVKKKLTVNGTLTAKKASIQELEVNGSCHLADCTVGAKSTVTGRLSALRSTFRQELVISAFGATFSGCKLESVVIKKPFWAFGKQELELSDGTICKGPIIFESGKGKVILKGKSQVLGAINGAEIEKL